MDNHKQTVKVIEELQSEVTVFHTKAKEYNAQKTEIKNNADLNSDGKEKRLNTLAESFEKEAISANENIKSMLDVILQTETDAAQQFDITDVNFLNCVNLINALNGKITEEIKTTIISKFTGNNQALLLLKDVFLRYDIDTMDIDKAIIEFSALESKLEELEHLFYFATRDYNNAYVNVASAYTLIEELKEILHIEDINNDDDEIA